MEMIDKEAHALLRQLTKKVCDIMVNEERAKGKSDEECAEHLADYLKLHRTKCLLPQRMCLAEDILGDEIKKLRGEIVDASSFKDEEVEALFKKHFPEE